MRLCFRFSVSEALEVGRYGQRSQGADYFLSFKRNCLFSYLWKIHSLSVNGNAYVLVYCNRWKKNQLRNPSSYIGIQWTPNPKFYIAWVVLSDYPQPLFRWPIEFEDCSKCCLTAFFWSIMLEEAYFVTLSPPDELLSHVNSFFFGCRLFFISHQVTPR